ncbi:hypothetical protein GQ53DRAFT_521419 [Thozetella sp. PMI_491]|nr:hypothetical protein GQ53DRAFT_521419 [Thozetella sp. PMI_491]
MRGPGKKRRDTKYLQEQASLLQTEPQTAHVSSARGYSLSNDDDLSSAPWSLLETESDSRISHNTIGLEARLRHLYPAFVHPENAPRTLQDLKRAAQEDQKSSEGFASLVSQDLIAYMLGNTFEDIAMICPIFELPALHRLNVEQHAVSSTHPSGNAARWAILSTWIALAMHLKTVLGSEEEFGQVVRSYYRNAVLVLPDLILQPANTETIQALLLMTAFAEATEDHRSGVMLVTNASRQMELLAQRLSGVFDKGEREAYQQLLSFARSQDRKVAEKYGISSILSSVELRHG